MRLVRFNLQELRNHIDCMQGVPQSKLWSFPGRHSWSKKKRIVLGGISERGSGEGKMEGKRIPENSYSFLLVRVQRVSKYFYLLQCFSA